MRIGEAVLGPVMWTTQVSDAGDGVCKFQVRRGSDAATYADVIDAWRTDAPFRSWFNTLLAAASFTAFRWETPAVSSATAAQSFEFVLLEAPYLAREADASAFGPQFRDRSDSLVLTFPNLGRDAIMVVPRPLGAETAYGHLGAFVRGAPEPQRDALWRAVGDAMALRLRHKPVWLSTAGAGVPWLHVRLDDRPKYYGFEPYRNGRPAEPER
jgi:hypothetical protein